MLQYKYFHKHYIINFFLKKKDQTLRKFPNFSEVAKNHVLVGLHHTMADVCYETPQKKDTLHLYSKATFVASCCPFLWGLITYIGYSDGGC